MSETPDTPHPTPDDDGTHTESVTPDAIDPVVDTDVPERSTLKGLGMAAIVLIVLLFAASQVFLITSLRSTQDQIEALDGQMSEFNGDLFDMSVAVDGIADDARKAAATNSAGEATPAPVLGIGTLPRFSEGAPDQAVGLRLRSIEGPDAYGGDVLAIDPADGTKRIWLVWAHWCPYCQQELPEVSAWWPEAKANFPNSELVSITTSIDPSRGNPLEPYLEDGQFPFTTVVDPDNSLAAQFGVNAFPFWLVTDGDGTVLFRTAGALSIGQVEQMFTQLEQFDA